MITLAVSCAKAPEGPLLPEGRHVIMASVGEGPGVKTVLHPEDDTQVYWSPCEEVGIFTGNNLISPYLFTGTNATATASARFEGDGPASLGTYIMVYPYDATSSWTSPNVTTTLPSSQMGKAGSFADGMAVMAGTSSTASVLCRHVCSGIRFMVTGSDILFVSLKGNKGEKIAGRFSFHFVDGVPVAGAGTEDEIVLTPAGGGCFTPGEWYYITCLPTVFTEGITLTAISASRGVGTYAINSSLTFTRSIFKYKENLDDAMSWTKVSPSVNNTYYGPANSFCLEPNGSVSIDVNPKFITPEWKRSGVSIGGTTAVDPAVLWGDSSLSSVSIADGKLSVTASDTPGSALVAIKNGTTILWSFLIWVTSSSPAEANLGGELYFQWGRKDPLKKDCAYVDNQGDDGLTYSIQHPTVFIQEGANAQDWFTGTIGKNDNTLWGSSKTVWDPCPSGWKVPESGSYGYSGCGFLNPTWWEDAMFWTCTSTFHDGAAYAVSFNNSGVTANDYRYYAAPVRCVRE